MNLLKDESIESDKLRKAACKPRHGTIFDRRQKCKSIYRKRIREREKSRLTSYTNDLHECLLKKNGPTFWKCWNSKFESRNTCVEVDGCVDESTIADKFANRFHGAYSCNNASRAAEMYAEYRRLRKNYQGLPLLGNFDVELISCVLSKLKRGKAADLDNLTAEHLMYSRPILSFILSKVPNCSI